MTPNQAIQTLELAMKEMQPTLYAKMAADGSLRPFLDRQAGAIMGAREEAHHSLANDRAFFSMGAMERVQEANNRTRAAEEVALAQGIEEIQSLTE